MVDHGRLMSSMCWACVDHGRPWSTTVEHGRSWSTRGDHSTSRHEGFGTSRTAGASFSLDLILSLSLFPFKTHVWTRRIIFTACAIFQCSHLARMLRHSGSAKDRWSRATSSLFGDRAGDFWLGARGVQRGAAAAAVAAAARQRGRSHLDGGPTP